MAEQDHYMKKLLEDKVRFADFVNVNVFHGKQVLAAEDLSLLANETGIVVIDPDGMRRTIERRRDVVMKASTALHKFLSNSTRYLRQEHACEASRRIHYAVASQTHT